MSTLTIRLPDDTHARMKVLARHRAVSVNKLMEELCTTSPSRSMTLRRGSMRWPRTDQSRKDCVSSANLMLRSAVWNRPLSWSPARSRRD